MVLRKVYRRIRSPFLRYFYRQETTVKKVELKRKLKVECGEWNCDESGELRVECGVAVGHIIYAAAGIDFSTKHQL